MNGFFIATLILFAVTFVYASIIGGWRETLTRPVDAHGLDDAEAPLLSVIIPARDEAENMVALLQDLHAQLYPRERLEVLVVDDGSTDATASIVQGMMLRWPQLRLLKSDAVGKKAAITTGVHAAKGELVLLTDADVRCGRERVRSVVAHWMNTQSEMVVLPVITGGDGPIGGVQQNEQAALLGMAMATALQGQPTIAYGANLAFTRAAFHLVGGYGGDRFASGDDLFLLQRMQRNGKRITALFNGTVAVTTTAAPTLRALLQQRLRWAGKMRAGGTTSFKGVIALLIPWVLLGVTLRFDLAGNMGGNALFSALLLCGAWVCWLFPVVLLVRDVRRITGQQGSQFGTVLSFLAFSFYAPLVAITALVLRPTWKGRRI